MRTDPHILKHDLDQMVDEKYRTTITEEELKTAQALMRGADFAFPHVMRNQMGPATLVSSVSPLAWTIGLLAAIKYGWLSIEVAMALVGVPALLAILLWRSALRERARVTRLFTDPFLDARTIINGKDARADGQSWIEGSASSMLPPKRT